MIKKFEDFINESITYFDAIDDIRPDESIIVKFPANFELEYTKGHGSTTVHKFICDHLDIWYIYDDDYRAIKYFLHTEPYGTSICKIDDLTPESRKKVWDYLKNTPMK